MQLQEEVLCHAVVVARRGAREDVVGHAEAAEVLDDDSAVLVDELPRGDAFPVRLIRDGRAVLVRAARHQDTGAAQPLEASEHVRGHRKSNHMADVTRSIRVWPRGRDEDGAGVSLWSCHL